MTDEELRRALVENAKQLSELTQRLKAFADSDLITAKADKVLACTDRIIETLSGHTDKGLMP